MFCDEALDAVEAIASGEVTPEGRIAEHLSSCPNCASALAGARSLDGMLRARPVPKPPPQFTSRALARVRRARWRSDQWVDAGFNVAFAAVVAGIAVGAWMLLNRTGLAAISQDVVALFGTGLVAFTRRVVPSVPVYAAATAVLASALAVWWWAERDNLI